jgi:hypothetical protein
LCLATSSSSAQNDIIPSILKHFLTSFVSAMIFTTVWLLAAAVCKAITIPTPSIPRDSISLSPTQVPATAVCAGSCGPVVSLLAVCDLPTLNGTLPDVQLTLRNVSGAYFGEGSSAEDYYGDYGPETNVITDYSQAKCLCTDGIRYLPACDSCLYANRSEAYGSYTLEYYYNRDCGSWGYWGWAANSNLSAALPLGLPSTTRDSVPTVTAIPAAANSSADLGRCPVCDVIEEQLEQCDLPDLLTAAPLYPDDGTNVNGTVFDYLHLPNRSVAECFCTLPVLRSVVACRGCIINTKTVDSNLSQVLNGYGEDCHNFGYWTDSQVVIYKSSASTSMTAAFSNPLHPLSSLALGLMLTLAMLSSL